MLDGSGRWHCNAVSEWYELTVHRVSHPMNPDPLSSTSLYILPSHSRPSYRILLEQRCTAACCHSRLLPPAPALAQQAVGGVCESPGCSSVLSAVPPPPASRVAG